MHVDEAIARRRTHKVFDGTELDAKTVEALLQAAIWAPNHRYTEPWRFTVVLGDARLHLADALHDALEQMRKRDQAASAKLETKQRKLRRRCAEAGAVIVFTYVASPGDPALDREDYAATACAVQNAQLAATARGLACLWSTSSVFSRPSVRQWLGLPETESLVAALFVGGPVQELQGRRHKPLQDVVRWL